MRKILVTGSGGQVGRAFQDLLASRADLNCRFLDRSTFDLEDVTAMCAVLDAFLPDLILNCAAYTAVDRAESEPDRAAAVNATAPARLARWCAENSARLLHFSTDYVYADRYNRPLRETDATDPKSAYAATKLAGEQAVSAALPGAYIVRTSWVYGPGGKNFVNTMLHLGKERDRLTVVADQIGSPTYAPHLAAAAWQLIEAGAAGGTYNYSNEGVCSWYDFAHQIMQAAGLECRVLPIPSSDYPTPAARPHFSVLDKAKIKTVIGEIPHYSAGLQEFLSH